MCKRKQKDMLKLSKINIGTSILLDDYKIEGIEYNDKDYSGLITINFDGDYEKIDSSFDHEFGTEEGHHYELKNVRVKTIECDLTYQSDTELETQIELTITHSPIFNELAEIIEGLNVNE